MQSVAQEMGIETSSTNLSDPDSAPTLGGFKYLNKELKDDREDMAHIANLMMKNPVYRDHMKHVAEVTFEKGKISKAQKSEFVNWLGDMGQMGAEEAMSQTMREALQEGAGASEAVSTATSGALGGVASIAAVISGAMEISESDDPAIQAEAAVNIASGAAGGAAAALDMTAAVLGAAPVPGSRVLAGISVVLGGLARGVGAIVKDITMKKHYEKHNQGTENLFDGNRAQVHDNWRRSKYENHGIGYWKNNEGDRVFGPNVQRKPEFDHLRTVILHATKVRRTLVWREDLFQEDLENFEPEELLSTTDDPAVKKAINHLKERHLKFKLADKQGGPSGWLIVKDDKWHDEAQKLEGLIKDKKHMSEEVHKDYQKMQEFLKSQTVDELHKLKKSDMWKKRKKEHETYGFEHIANLAEDEDEIAKFNPKESKIQFLDKSKWGDFKGKRQKPTGENNNYGGLAPVPGGRGGPFP